MPDFSFPDGIVDSTHTRFFTDLNRTVFEKVKLVADLALENPSNLVLSGNSAKNILWRLNQALQGIDLMYEVGLDEGRFTREEFDSETNRCWDMIVAADQLLGFNTVGDM